MAAEAAAREDAAQRAVVLLTPLEPPPHSEARVALVVELAKAKRKPNTLRW